METIPTPRTTAFYKMHYNPSVPDVMIEHASGKEREFMRQLERELHIAKQALEEIITKGDYLNSDRAADAVFIAESAIKSLNILSA